MPKKKNHSPSIEESVESQRSQEPRVTNNVRKLRQERKWTQWQLAKISRLSERTVQRVESGDPLGVTAEMALASAFEVEVTALYENSSAQPPTDFQFLTRITTGKRLLDLVESVDYIHFETDNLKDHQVEPVKEFFQNLDVWALLWRSKEPAERITARHIFSSIIDELDASGIWIFAGCSAEVSPDGAQKEVGRLAILGADNPRIVQPKRLRPLGKEMSYITVAFSQ